MRLLFVLDPFDTLKPTKDSSIELLRAAQTRNHESWAAEPNGLSLEQGHPTAWCRPLKLSEHSSNPHEWYQTGAASVALQSFDAILMRKDPPVDSEYIVSTYLLELAQKNGVKVYNRPGALRDFNEKLSTLRFPQFSPPCCVARRQEPLRAFIRQQGEVILKPLDGMGGREIFRVSEQDPNLSVILETLTQRGQRTIMAQRYLSTISQGDKRVLMVDGEPIPWCLARLPAPGETRGNLAAGGTGRAQTLSPRDREIANHLGPLLRSEGLLLVGLDIIGDSLTEINVTSPTCMREIRDQTGFDTATAVIQALERHYHQAAPTSASGSE